MAKFNVLDLKRSVLIPGLLIFVTLFLLNAVSKNWFFRFDLTKNNMYSLSTSSRAVVEQINDLLTMKVYFSDDLPGEYANNRRYLQDILEEYAAFSKGNIRFEFFRPEDDQDIEQEAQKSGIMPVQMQVVENDKMEIKRVLMGVVILYEDQKEVIPVIQTTTGLEYDITTKIKKLVETNKPTVGIAAITEQMGEFQNIRNVISQRYSVRQVQLAQTVPDNINTLLLGGVTDSLTTDEIDHLRSYLDRGGNLLLAQNRVNTELQFQQAFPVKSNIFDITTDYGCIIEENLVIDKLCGSISVQQQLGPLRMNVPMEYPLLPIVRTFNTEEPIVAGLEQIQMLFTSEIKPDTAIEDQVKFVPLLFSSDRSGEMRGQYNLDPDPQRNPILRLFNSAGKILGVRVEKITDNGIMSQLILLGDSNFMNDDGGGQSPENNIFIMNCVDFLQGDRDLIALRSREITSRPLSEITDDTKRTWKWVNIITPSLLIIAFGLVQLRRQKNRSNVLEELYG